MRPPADPRKEPGGSVAHRPGARASLRSIAPYVVIGVLLLLAVLLAGRELEQHIDALEAWIDRLGPWGVLAFVALFVLTTTLLVPDTVLCFAAGALFGLAWGVAAVVGGSLLACALQYALSRKLLRARIARMLAARPSLAAIQRAVVRDEFRLQVLLRLAPLNPAMVSYLLGAAGVRLSGFLVACLALAPALSLEVYLGHAAKHMVRMAGTDQPDRGVHDLALVVGAVICVAVMIVMSRFTHKALAQATADSNPEVGS